MEKILYLIGSSVDFTVVIASITELIKAETGSKLWYGLMFIIVFALAFGIHYLKEFWKSN